MIAIDGLVHNILHRTGMGSAVNQSLQLGPTDRFLDAGLDTQYQYIDDESQITVTGSALHEDERLDASYLFGNSANPANHLNSENLVASYFWHREIGGNIGFFNLTGSSDSTYFGTPNGRSDSTWGQFEVDYVPWLNVKLGLQYTAYTKFNGATSNYDGNGRNASDNNFVYGYLWIAY